MAYKIDNSQCISCGTCEGVCPSSAISHDNDVYTIDPIGCVDCGVCEGACPVSCIHPGSEFPEYE